MKSFIQKPIRAVVKGAIYSYSKIFHRVKIEGKENIPKNEPLIFCGNHRTYLDPALITATVKPNVRFLAKAELAKNPLFRFLGNVFEDILVHRNSKDVTAIKTSLKALKNGECIGLFPEGTRNGLAKGEEVKDGAAFLALRSGARVIPVGISGKTGAFSKVYLKFGKPLDFSGYDKKSEESLEKVTKEIMENIIELSK